MAQIDEVLLAAYTATDFVVFDADGPWVLHVGKAAPQIDELLARHGCRSATIVTALNPRSKVLGPAENAARHAKLKRILATKGCDFVEGEGRDPTGAWVAETECVIFGTTLAQGLDLARSFEQNAIVFLETGKAPRLEFPKG
jgi:hypothetical protein